MIIAEQEAVRFPVFRDEDGNRFVFPELYAYQEKSVSWSYCINIETALRVTREKETFDVVPEDGFLNFSRVEASAGSRGFAHGSATVWLISGPRFDAIIP